MKLIRTKEREGLIRARLIGARMAKGPVIMFQDAHTEANTGIIYISEKKLENISDISWKLQFKKRGLIFVIDSIDNQTNSIVSQIKIKIRQGT